MEDFDLGLEETVIETSPDFDESREELPKKKRRRKAVTKKERERLVKLGNWSPIAHCDDKSLS